MDLPSQLQWQHPSQRSGHMAAFHPTFHKTIVYGGVGIRDESPYQVAKTLAADPLADLWQYDLANCDKNCSLHGDYH
jgi:hypothetical protein